ncbi:MAG: hypothetical protein LHW51_13380 [Candidatus Cloacimonetes bacterium]|nr:hypothetical protein [Candidatus Cloacimonadota bacterium]MCK9242720.1 hypothetical protein [Candidatus Cloacimonadota bacterium]
MKDRVDRFRLKNIDLFYQADTGDKTFSPPFGGEKRSYISVLMIKLDLAAYKDGYCLNPLNLLNLLIPRHNLLGFNV